MRSQICALTQNYFTLDYVYKLTRTVRDMKLNYASIEVDGVEYDLTSNNCQLEDLCYLIPGRKVKITCSGVDDESAFANVNKVRKLIEYDFTPTTQST